jgi:hypothetical protein
LSAANFKRRHTVSYRSPPPPVPPFGLSHTAARPPRAQIAISELSNTAPHAADYAGSIPVYDDGGQGVVAPAGGGGNGGADLNDVGI